MSLKAFHLFFIIISILFAAGFGVWLLTERPFGQDSFDILSALCSFSVAGGLVLYAIRFLRKFKHLRFL